jgi:glycosyltransferase involved in cell wall biosynthesis
MLHISELFKNNNFIDKPWIIIGKGPSFSKINEINIKDFYSFGLNHVITKVDYLDVVHLIDFDVFEGCCEDIYKKARYLFMPINPHFNNSATMTTLKDLIETNEILKKLSQEKRLFWYNHIAGKQLLSAKNSERALYENVEVKYFSAEAPFYILGMNGIRDIYSVGIDGGSSYNSSFSNSSLLANGRPSFDIQFGEVIKTIKKYDLIYSPLDATYPVKVYVGSQEEQMLSVKVLEYSIKKRTKVAVEVFPLYQANIQYPTPKDLRNQQRTPFSFQRFLIPQLNNFQGKAIYMDSDMQVTKDIRQLWNLPMASHDLFTVENKEDSKRDLQFSVMLLDCNKLRWSINDVIQMLDNGELNYHSLMQEMKVVKNLGVKIPYSWNCLEWYKEGTSALIHYTDMPTQPWVSRASPLCKIWMKDLIDAIKDGFIKIEMVKDHIEKGWVRPSLLYQIENNIFDSLDLPEMAVNMDRDFIAPYKKMNLGVSTYSKSQNSGLTSFRKKISQIFNSKPHKYFIGPLMNVIKEKLKRLNKIINLKLASKWNGEKEIIKNDLSFAAISQKSICFIVSNKNKSYILDRMAKEISTAFESSIHHYGVENIPKADRYFVTHYSMLPAVFKQVNPKVTPVICLFTHDKGDLPRHLEFFKLCKIIVALCQEGIEILVKLGVSRKILYFIPECADPSQFPPHTRTKDGAILICGTNYEDGRKNPELAGEVIKLLPNRKFIFLGKNWDRFANNQNVTICDVEYEDFWSIYCQCSVYLSCSKLEGGGPNSLIEAMHANLVPVVSDTGNSRDYIADGNNGFIFSAEDRPEKVVELIEKAYNFEPSQTEPDSDIWQTVRRFTWYYYANQMRKIIDHGC